MKTLLLFLVISSLYSQVPTGPIGASGSGGIGSINGISAVCGLTGSVAGNVGTVMMKPTVNLQTGASYTLLASDCGGLIQAGNPSGISISIPNAVAPYGAGFEFDVLATGNGGASIIPTTATIDGNSTYTLLSGQSIHIWSDGTNWQVGKGAPRWGAIGGTLSIQSDLQSALNSKISGSGGSVNKAVCWKTVSIVGFCSTQPDSSGTCTCN